MMRQLTRKISQWLCSSPTSIKRNISSETHSAFHSLPDDVLVHIFLLGASETLFVYKQVCRRFRSIVDKNIYLQYKMELALDGMVDGPQSCPMNVGERLKHLREYSAKYHALLFTSSQLKYCWKSNASNSGAPTTDWRNCLGFGGSISYITLKPPQRQISVCASPLFTGSREMRDWPVPYSAITGTLDKDMLCVSADVSQDLLFVAVSGDDARCITIYLRSLRHPEQPHPQAVQPTLSIPIPGYSNAPIGNSQPLIQVCSVQIYNGIVAWMLSVINHDRSTSVVDVIEIWDWRAGSRLRRSAHNTEDTFTILDDTHIVLASPANKHLRVEYFGPHREEDWPLLLEVPYKHIYIEPSSIPSPPSSDPQPFWTDPALRVVVVGILEEGVLLIPYKTFFNLISVPRTAKKSATGDDMHNDHSVSWKQWSSRGALLVHNPQIWPSRGPQPCYAYGSRIVLPSYKHASITIFDVNPLAERGARRFPQLGSSPQLTMGKKKAKQAFGTMKARLPHLAMSLCHQTLQDMERGLAMDPLGFTEFTSYNWPEYEYLGSISHYV